jgi:protein phosphatase
MQPVEADLSIREARAGDRYLLCSDGLTGVVSDEELAAILSEGEPTGTVITLVELALSRGAPDNVTVVVADVLEVEQGTQQTTEPVVVGAAGEPRVRAQLPQIHFPDDAQPDPNRPPPPPPADSGPPTSEFPAITAPLAGGESGMSGVARYRWRIVGITAGALAVLLIAVGSLGFLWLRSQWYVGVDTGRVTVFQGVPGTILSVPMQSPREVTEVNVADLPTFDAELVTRGIVADSRSDAERIAHELRQRAEACQRARPPAGCPTVDIGGTVRR